MLISIGSEPQVTLKIKSMNKKFFLLCFIMLSLALVQCNHTHHLKQTATSKGLKDYYKNYFPIGVAVSERSLKDRADSELILQQFNSVTPENAMKMGPIHPGENFYNWKNADSIVAFAMRHHLRVRGHNLCWHEQAPKWFFTDSSGKLVSKEVLLKRLKDHITTVVNRYKGKIYAWDVVNEAVDDNPDNLLRHDLFYKICGPEYVAKAFEYAHTADPNAVLFYNDYNLDRKEKVDRVYRLLKQLKDEGVPVDAVGLQGHWSIYEPSKEQLEYALNKLASLGLKIQITELDMSLYKWEKNRRAKTAADVDTYTPELAQKQADQYKIIFDVLREHKKDITGVTFWNISDKHTWLDFYPVPGRKNYPLLFDTTMKPKKAYWEVVNFKK
jgi:endo-1,4-beta-xylanase